MYIMKVSENENINTKSTDLHDMLFKNTYDGPDFLKYDKILNEFYKANEQNYDYENDLLKWVKKNIK